MDSTGHTHIVDPTRFQILRRAPVEEYAKLAPSPLRVVLVDCHNLNGTSPALSFRPRPAKFLRELFASRL